MCEVHSPLHSKDNGIGGAHSASNSHSLHSNPSTHPRTPKCNMPFVESVNGKQRPKDILKGESNESQNRRMVWAEKDHHDHLVDTTQVSAGL